eukprot:scaffold124015_cov63-Phaeocystis_antarctica.AAC.2
MHAASTQSKRVHALMLLASVVVHPPSVLAHRELSATAEAGTLWRRRASSNWLHATVTMPTNAVYRRRERGRVQNDQLLKGGHDGGENPRRQEEQPGEVGAAELDGYTRCPTERTFRFKQGGVSRSELSRLSVKRFDLILRTKGERFARLGIRAEAVRDRAVARLEGLGVRRRDASHTSCRHLDVLLDRQQLARFEHAQLGRDPLERFLHLELALIPRHQDALALGERSVHLEAAKVMVKVRGRDDGDEDVALGDARDPALLRAVFVLVEPAFGQQAVQHLDRAVVLIVLLVREKVRAAAVIALLEEAAERVDRQQTDGHAAHRVCRRLAAHEEGRLDEEHGHKVDTDYERAEAEHDDEQDVRCQEARQVELACSAPSDAAVADQADSHKQQDRDTPELIHGGLSGSARQGGQASGFAEVSPRRVPTRRLVAVQRLTAYSPREWQGK